MIDTDRLRQAIAVAREGSISAAAAAIPMSQSALTRSIQSLEHHYGIKIFERGSSGSLLTANGARFLQLCETFLSREVDLEDELLSISSAIHSVASFGLDPIKFSTFLPTILPEALDQGVRCKVLMDQPQRLRRSLRHGEIEFYLGGVPRAEIDTMGWAEGLDVQEIPAGRFALVVRAGHPLLDQEPTPEALSKYELAHSYYLREYFAPAALASIGLRAPTVVVDDFEFLAKMARERDYVVIASNFLCYLRPDLGLASLSLKFSVPKHLVWAFVYRKNERLSPAARQVCQLFKDRVDDCLLNLGI